MDKEKIAEYYYNFTVKQGWKLAGFERKIFIAAKEFARGFIALLPQGGEGGLVDSDTKCDLLDEFMACYSGGLDVVLQSNVSNLLDAAFKAQKLLDDINKEKEKAEIFEKIDNLISYYEDKLGHYAQEITKDLIALKNQVLGED